VPQALKYIRDVGFGQMDDGAQEEENRAMRHRPGPKRLYTPRSNPIRRRRVAVSLISKVHVSKHY
jgi:hypothetical protein